MRNDSFGDDPKTIWQQQRMEPSTMTLEMIGQKARELRAETRRELFASITIALFVFAISVYGFPRTHSLALQLAFAFASAWALAGQRFLHWGMWSGDLPAEVALNSGLEFYRRELKRRRRFFTSVLQWTFGPFVLSVCTITLELVGIGRNRNLRVRSIIPFCMVFGIWIVVFFIIRSRRQRDLQREIDELNLIENTNTH